jgi:light-independent protochlorophyllide reductase subunit B
MQLTLWTYEGPPHVGAMRVATAMRDVHYVLHAPQGDTYADLLFTMIERRNKRPPVTYTTFQARDLGGDTAELFKTAAREAYERFQPQGHAGRASCTAELIQDDPGGLAKALNLPIPVVALELPSYQRKENWGASETFYQLVRAPGAPMCPPRYRSARAPGSARAATCWARPRWASATATTCARSRPARSPGHRRERGRAAGRHAPDLARLARPTSTSCCTPRSRPAGRRWLQRTFGQPTRTVPIGVNATREFIAEVAARRHRRRTGAGRPGARTAGIRVGRLHLPHRQARVRVRRRHACHGRRPRGQQELGFTVVGLGTYSREFAREVREAAKLYGVEAADHRRLPRSRGRIAELQPELVLGTQMERHIAKRLACPAR